MARVLCWRSSVILTKIGAPWLSTELLLTLGRHHFRPNHLYAMVDSPEFHKLKTALNSEGGMYPSSDISFGAKKSLVMVGMHYPLVRVAGAPHPQSQPVFLPFLTSLPWNGEIFLLDRNSLKSMTKSRHESVGSGTVSGPNFIYV